MKSATTRRGRYQFGPKELCPCGKSSDYHPILNSPGGGGQCFNRKCGQKWFPPKPTKQMLHHLSAVRQSARQASGSGNAHAPRSSGSGNQPVESSTITTDMTTPAFFGAPDRIHIYHDEDGNPLYRILVKKHDVGTGKNVIAQRWDGTTYVNGLGDISRVLYRLPDVLKGIQDGRQIIIVEGEKDADTLMGHGLVATTAVGGACKWAHEYSSVLDGADVLIIPDLDDIGQRHGREVAESLRSVGYLASLRILDLHALGPDLPEKSDVSDYLEGGGSLDALLEHAATLPDLASDGKQYPTLPQGVYDNLPEPLAGILHAIDDNEERATLLLACLTTLSSVLPNVHFRYHRTTYNAPLYLFVLGPAGSGKAIACHALELVRSVDDRLAREHEENMKRYNREQEEYRSTMQKSGRATWRGDRPTQRGDVPVMPERRCLIAPADSTAPSINILLAANGSILIADSEADSLATALNQDHGDLSPVLRKAFGHEPVAISRVQDRRFVSCERPRLAVLLSGTPRQLLPLLRDSENGLASRFAYHIVRGRDEFINPFENQHHDIRDTVRAAAGGIDELYGFLWALGTDDVVFRLTPEQEADFHARYSRRKSLSSDDHEAITGAIHRLGIIEMRIAMILTVLRLWLKDRMGMARRLTCSEEDYRTASLVSEYFLHTASTVLGYLPRSPNPSLARLPNRTAEWFAALPDEVTTREAITQGEYYGVPKRTVERTLRSSILFRREGRAKYRKVPP